MKHKRDCCFNKGVACDNIKHCHKCGWNPKVAVERKERLRAKIIKSK